MKRPFITTFTGREVTPLYPTVGQADIVDIAHHLATINRWLGALVTPVSCAQHAVMVALEAYRRCKAESDRIQQKSVLQGLPIPTDRPPSTGIRFGWGEVILAALLHDAHEFALGDWPSPISGGVVFQRLNADGAPELVTLGVLKREWNQVIALDLGLNHRRFAALLSSTTIRRPDGAALHAEARDLTVADKAGWSGLRVPPLEAPVESWDWQVAKERFLAVWETWKPGSVRYELGHPDPADPLGCGLVP